MRIGSRVPRFLVRGTSGFGNRAPNNGEPDVHMGLRAIVLVLLCGLLLVAAVWRVRSPEAGEASVPATVTGAGSLLAVVNAQRAAGGEAPLAGDADLDELAEQLLAAMLAAECLCPAELLDADDAAGLAASWAPDDSGTWAAMVGWSLDAVGAARAAVGAAQQRAILLDPRWDSVGLASVPVSAGSRWLVANDASNAPDSAGSAMTPADAAQLLGLAGYTVTVVVFRADDVAGP